MYLLAGGKGATLAKLFQKGYPVPDGFVVFPAAFSEDRLLSESWEAIAAAFHQLRHSRNYTGAVAVRSSAFMEDSAHASFAGGYETVLNVSTDEGIREAIEKVYRSRNSKRIESYSRAKGMDVDGRLAVIVQNMVPAEISGVLFTADPVSGNHLSMTGNYVIGLGDRLVSGEEDGNRFFIDRQKGEYGGSKALQSFSSQLHQLALKLEKDLARPQDIEWSIAGKKLYLLQSRHITTAVSYNPASGERNDSLTGDFLWSNVNFGEAIPDVMTPFTASALELGPVAQSIRFKGHSAYGTICGRPYLNISVFASIFAALGKNREQIVEMLDGVANVPEGVEIPLISSSKTVLFHVLPQLIAFDWRQRRDLKRMPLLVAKNRSWCNESREVIERTRTAEGLVALWEQRIKPHLLQMWSGVLSSAKHHSDYTANLQRELVKEVGPDDADALISGMSSDLYVLESLGPLLGLAKVSRGEMSGQEYIERYGHRGPHELELSCSRASEEPGWLGLQLENYGKGCIDVDRLLADQRGRFNAAWEHLTQKRPGKEKEIAKRIGEVARRARLREEVRSEYARIFGVWRHWALQAGRLTAVGEDVFFLTIDEALALIKGNGATQDNISVRKESYERYKTLPPYPTLIKGRFDPFLWASNPQREDQYNLGSSSVTASTDTINGIAGSAGFAEGIVRCLNSPEEGDQLLAGEILVTTHTNIGWTFIFPQAAAIITDVGAPLSHAAIVARELGIPAVVGCGNATKRLKTGDRVKVDGARGLVEIVSS
jgi:pyruvate,water dikinase